jgi:hypothetical protein
VPTPGRVEHDVVDQRGESPGRLLGEPVRHTLRGRAILEATQLGKHALAKLLRTRRRRCGLQARRQ